MFTGIIETMGEIIAVEPELSNIHFIIRSGISNALKVDQSVAHNGVCLTVTEVTDNTHRVTAIAETLDKTDLAAWKPGTMVNLERCMPANGRFDGHIVQGHVDCTAVCTAIQDMQGSWKYTFVYESRDVTVEKGSITVNGTSLTVVDSAVQSFSVAIIPYTYEHTVFRYLQIGDRVNLEFDIIGKYVARLLGR
jgi:riboflavin synthase